MCRLKISVSSALLSLTACAQSTELELSFPDSTTEQFMAAQEAAAEWSVCPGVHVHLSHEDGGIPIHVWPDGTYGDGSYGSPGAATHWHRVALLGPKQSEHIGVEERVSTLRSTYSHEFGHALGLEHTPHGIMMPVPSPNTHVTALDCP